MNRRALLLCLLVCCMKGGPAGAETQQVWQVVAMAPEATRVKMPLPPLAKVASTDSSGQTWQQSGQMSGTVEGAHKEFAMAFGAAGWALNKTIALGRLSARSELMIWTRGKQRILLMLWEKETGTCGFAWGEER